MKVNGETLSLVVSLSKKDVTRKPDEDTPFAKADVISRKQTATGELEEIIRDDIEEWNFKYYSEKLKNRRYKLDLLSSLSKATGGK